MPMVNFSTKFFIHFKFIYFLFLIFSLGLFLDCSHSNNVRNKLDQDENVRDSYRKNRVNLAKVETYFGYASYYADEFHGRLTASGEVFDMNELTAAHRTLPFGTICRVTNLENKKSVMVRINDRGPFVENRILDLSRAAAKAIGAISSGVVQIKLEIISKPTQN
jgi:rare lipoprotein A (peptidoglycan hydrolase)